MLWHEVITLIVGAILGGFVTVLISRPSVKLSIAPPVDMRFTTTNEQFRSLRVDVANEARWWTLMAPAIACRAKISFHDLNGHDIFGRPMVGRWANSPVPAPTLAQGPGGKTLAIFDLDKFARESRFDIYPGESEPVDVIVRLGNDVDCYGWTNESNYEPRQPNWKLNKGVFLAKVTVSVSGRPHVRIFRIHNDAGRDALRLELPTPEEIRSISVT